jgi:hypothetical protein
MSLTGSALNRSFNDDRRSEKHDKKAERVVVQIDEQDLLASHVIIRVSTGTDVTPRVNQRPSSKWRLPIIHFVAVEPQRHTNKQGDHREQFNRPREVICTNK